MRSERLRGHKMQRGVTDSAGGCQGFFLIGAATMTAEIGWARDLGIVLGSDLEGISVSMGTCLFGAAAGAWWGGLRTQSPRPLLAASAAAFLLVALWCQHWLPAITEGWRALDHLAAKCLVAAPLLLAVVPLGAAVPVWLRAASGGEPLSARSAAIWVASLDFGAAAGSLITPLLFLPRFGPAITQILAAAMAAAAWRAAPAPRSAARSQVSPAGRKLEGRASALAFAAGFAGSALQVVWCRLLGEVLGTSLLVLGLAAAAQLLGAAIGSRAVPALVDRIQASHLLAGIAAVWAAAQAFAALMIAELPLLYLYLAEHAGFAMPAVKLALVLAVVLLPSLAAGAFFAALLGDAVRRREIPRRATSGLFGANLLGGAAGALAAGLLAIPFAGSGVTIAGLGAGTAAGAAAGMLLSSAGRGRGGAFAVVAAALAAAAPLAVAARGSWDRSLLGAGVFQWSREEIAAKSALTGWRSREVVYNREGRLARVMIELSHAQNTAFLRVGGRIEGSAPIVAGEAHLADLPTQLLLAVLPVLARGEGRETLIIGLGSGSTAAAAIEARTGPITVLEVEPAVVSALRSEAGSRWFPWETARLFGGERTPVIETCDARGYLHREPKRWQAIVCQPSEPWLPWSAPLFTEDFFRLVGERLTVDGVAIHWLQLHSIGEGEFAAILAAFRESFPHVLVYHPPRTGEILLAGSMSPFRAAEGAPRWVAPGVRAVRERLGWRSDVPPEPLLDGPGVDSWLLGRAGSLGNLRARLEYRLPLAAERGEDHTMELLESLRAARRLDTETARP